MKSFLSHSGSEPLNHFNRPGTAIYAVPQQTLDRVLKRSPRWSRSQASLLMVSAVFLLGACGNDMPDPVDPVAGVEQSAEPADGYDPAMPEAAAPEAMPDPVMPEAGMGGAPNAMSPETPPEIVVPEVAPEVDPASP